MCDPRVSSQTLLTDNNYTEINKRTIEQFSSTNTFRFHAFLYPLSSLTSDLSRLCYRVPTDIYGHACVCIYRLVLANARGPWLFEM